MLFPQCIDLRVVGGSLCAAIPTEVVVVAVAVVLAVGLVVFFVIADQIVQAEAVVGGDEVDAGVRPAAVVFVQVARSAQPGGEFRDGVPVAAPELADRVAVFAVPFGPEHRKVADLVAAFAQVPRLGDQLDLREHRVLVNDVEERRQLVDLVQLASQGAGQIEAEPVDVHFEHPVPQAVHDQLQHTRIEHVQRVAAAGVVPVVPRLFGHQPVVGGIVDPSQRQRRPEMVPFSGVVVNDVQDHLEPRFVQGADHAFELADRFAGRSRRRVACLGSKIGEGVVAPVV